MKRKTVDWMVMIVIAAAVIFAGCTELKSDEKQVAELIQKGFKYMNDGDWKSSYEQCSPGYRSAYPYGAFAEDCNKVMASVRVLGGKGKFTVDNINVRIKGDIAYATYVVKLDGDVLVSITEGDEDLFVKYDGVWYDMSDDEGAKFFGYNGWNEEDTAVLRKAEMLT
jgi:hypothetical protein